MVLPLVSCLCITEGRPAFMPWLLWCYERQTWPRRELVIVDSSTAPFHAPECGSVRVLAAPTGSRVADKRNQALRAAHGEVIAWFDDDDWQHPQRLELLVPLLEGGGSIAGPRTAWLLDLVGQASYQYAGLPAMPVFNGAVFRAEAARSQAFDAARRRGSDSVWLTQLLRSHCIREPEGLLAPVFFWLHHGGNLSLSLRHTRLRKLLQRTPLETLRALLGASAWGDTSERLEQLRSALGQPLSCGTLP